VTTVAARHFARTAAFSATASLCLTFPDRYPSAVNQLPLGIFENQPIDGELVMHGLGAVVDPSSSAMRLKSRVPSSFSVMRNASRAERACVASRAWRPTMSWKSGILRRSRAAWSETALPVVVLLGLSVPAFERSEEERIRVTERRHPGRRG